MFLDALLIANWSLAVSWRQVVDRVGAATAYHHRCVQALAQMRHTSSLLSHATSAARAIGRNDLADYFANHESEERDHWCWAMSDLKAARQFPGTVLRVEIVAPSINRMIERQYADLRSGNVAGFLGYVVALEGLPGSASDWCEFAVLHGLPEAAFSSPIQHAATDQRHARDLFELIEGNLSVMEVDGAVDEARKTIWDLRDAIDACPNSPQS